MEVFIEIWFASNILPKTGLPLPGHTIGKMLARQLERQTCLHEDFINKYHTELKDLGKADDNLLKMCWWNPDRCNQNLAAGIFRYRICQNQAFANLQKTITG